MRRLPLAVLALFAAALMATSMLVSQPPRVQWQAFRLITSAPVNGTALLPPFRRSLSPAQTVHWGQAEWRAAGMNCTFSTAGTTDGGTNSLVMAIAHLNADAGLGDECTCEMSTSSCTATNAQLMCDCDEGVVQLSGDLDWYVRYVSGCATNPSQGFCSIDLYR